MRIFFASVCTSVVNGVPGIYTTNLRDSLVRMGHEVVDSSIDWDALTVWLADSGHWAKQGRPELSERLFDELSKAHSQAHIDLFFASFFSIHVDPDIIYRIRQLGIVTVNYYCDAAHGFHLVSEIAPAFDLCWATEKNAIPAYQAIGARAVHIQMGANPDFYRPLGQSKRDVPVLFFGGLWANRSQILAGMKRGGVPLKVVSGMGCIRSSAAKPDDLPTQRHSYVGELTTQLKSYGFASLGRRFWRKYTYARAIRTLLPVIERSPEEDVMLRMFSRSEIVLNLCDAYMNSEPGGKLVQYVRLRDFEVPMSRALLCSQYSEELSLYYDLDKEIIAWRSVREACDKIRYYLDHPAEAETVRAAGHRRALNDHTWERRFGQLFDALSLRSKAAVQ